MKRLTILSPHRDDAIFSLGLALSEWAGQPELNIDVVNFFTVSQYAPRTPLTSITGISAARAREDRLTLREAGLCIQQTSLELLDAPLRTGLHWSQVCRPEVWHVVNAELVEQLARKLDQRFNDAIMLAPLGLGNHLDHITVRQAALRAARAKRLAFYEDLPYASWTPELDIHQHVRKIEGETRLTFRPTVLRGRPSFSTKLRLASRYRSQISRQEAATIARYSAKCRGERIWIPEHSGHWLRLLPRRYHPHLGH
jgi:LmbE family N-acetylglucosaminyl deacetylase